MFVTQTIKSICIRTADLSRSAWAFIINLPGWLRIQKQEMKNNFLLIRKKMKNLYKTNLDLGLYHLRSGNINDAIMRLKIVDKFIAPNDSLTNYWLGWAYFLKGNYNKAEIHLLASKEREAKSLSNFITKYDSAKEVPVEVWTQYKKLISFAEIKNRGCYVANLPRDFVATLLDAMEELPKECSILDLGCSGGFIGAEVDNKLQKNYHLVGVDNNEELLKNAKHLKEDKRQIYDDLIDSSIEEFLRESKKKYDVVTSFNSLIFKRDLADYFKAISKILKASGHFALLLPISDETHWDPSGVQFIYSKEDVEKQLNLADFALIDIKEYSLNKYLSYLIFISKKSI